MSEDRKFQEEFYYLVQAESDGHVSTIGIPPEPEVQGSIAEATEGMVSVCRS